MNIFLLSQYISKLTKEDIEVFALKQGIVLTSDELDLINKIVKKDYKTFVYGNPKPILEDLKNKVQPLTYNKIENLYVQFKEKIR